MRHSAQIKEFIIPTKVKHENKDAERAQIEEDIKKFLSKPGNEIKKIPFGVSGQKIAPIRNLMRYKEIHSEQAVEIGKIVRADIKRRGITQADYGKLFSPSVTHNSISNWGAGLRMPEPLRRTRIMELAGESL